MIKDLIEKNFPWLTPWFCKPDPDSIKLNEEEGLILTELSSRWLVENKPQLFDTLAERFGRDAVGLVMEKVVEAHIKSEWAEVGRGQQSQSIDDLIRLLWEPLRASGFELQIEKQAEAVQIHCTRCPHVELARETNSAKWLYHLICSGDPHLVAGFNPKIGFRRTQTLMEGHPFCDHYYFMIE